MAEGPIVDQGDAIDPSSKHYEKSSDGIYFPPATNTDFELIGVCEPHIQRLSGLNVQDGTSQLQKMQNLPHNVTSSEFLGQERTQLKLIPTDVHRDVSPNLAVGDLTGDRNKDLRFIQEHQQGRNKEISPAIDDFDIPWSELILKEKIGAGSFGTVHRADWNGLDVAVKILMEQDFHSERLKEFLREEGKDVVAWQRWVPGRPLPTVFPCCRNCLWRVARERAILLYSSSCQPVSSVIRFMWRPCLSSSSAECN